MIQNCERSIYVNQAAQFKHKVSEVEAVIEKVRGLATAFIEQEKSHFINTTHD